MTYTVTFYTLPPSQPEAVVTVHRVEMDLLSAYTGAPAMVLASVRSGERKPQADGFRIVCPAGKTVLNYVGRVGQA